MYNHIHIESPCETSSFYCTFIIHIELFANTNGPIEKYFIPRLLGRILVGPINLAIHKTVQEQDAKFFPTPAALVVKTNQGF